MSKRIFLSPPYAGKAERDMVARAFDSNYIAPCGPQVDAFEAGLAKLAGRRFAVAVSSGTAALDLLMDCFELDSSWEVITSSLTFIASAGPAYHRGARLAFVDSDRSGNLDVRLLEKALEASRAPRKMVIAVDLYGRCCDYGKLEKLCTRFGAVLIVDSAEAVGAKCGVRPSGSAGVAAIYSFNGNKIITTSGGGAVLTDDPGIAAAVRKRSQQARENCLWYEHERVGYNYRLSNILGAIGLAQLARLPAILKKRAAIAAHYRALGGESLPPVAGENHWLNIRLAKDEAGRDALIAALAAENIESRPVWKPMHLQKVFCGAKIYGGKISEDLFRRGVCLPSGTGMTAADLRRVDKVLERFKA